MYLGSWKTSTHHNRKTESKAEKIAISIQEYVHQFLPHPFRYCRFSMIKKVKIERYHDITIGRHSI